MSRPGLNHGDAEWQIVEAQRKKPRGFQSWEGKGVNVEISVNTMNNNRRWI